MLSLQTWNQIKTTLIAWYTHPAHVLVPLVAIALALLFLRPSPWKTWSLQLVAAAIGVYIFLISPMGADAALFGLRLPLPQDDGQPADVAVVLGRGPLLRYDRSNAAAHLLQSHRVAAILLSGNSGEVKMLAQSIQEQGIANTSILGESCSRTTEENAILSDLILRRVGASRIVLITDAPHMLRAYWTFTSLGFEVIPRAMPLPRGLPSIQASALAMREYVGLVSYGLLGRFWPRSGDAARAMLFDNVCATRLKATVGAGP